jgi:hypothetical protein
MEELMTDYIIIAFNPMRHNPMSGPVWFVSVRTINLAGFEVSRKAFFR